MNALALFLYFLPGYVANMAPVVFRFVPVLDTPVDFGYKLGGKRIFGSHKTWRGIVFGLLSAYAVGSVTVDGTFGLVLGSGCLIGDLVKSFFKRRKKINPGKPWYVIDQLDYVVGGISFTWGYGALNFTDVIVLLVMSFAVTVLINHLSFALGIRKEKW